MGRAPCCDKANVKKGPWSPEEDAKLKAYIEQHGTGGNWIALPQKIGLKRCGKSCRLRWLNYLRPNIKHGGFSEEEDNIICSLYISIGSRWSIIAAQLPGRTDNDIKNYWNTRLKKKLLGKQRKEIQARRNSSKQNQDHQMRKSRENNYNMVSSSSSSDHNISNQNHPYWPPELPPVLLPYSNEEPRNFNDRASIRKLLIKLGGRFSNDDQPTNSLENLQFPLVDNSLVQPAALYQQQLEVLSSAAPVDVLNMTCSLPEMEYYKIESADHHLDMSMLTTPSNFVSELEQMIYKNPQKFDGLEFLYGDIMMNNNRLINGATTTCGGSCSGTGWGEMSSLQILPASVAPNYEAREQATLQDRVADHLRYPGA